MADKVKIGTMWLGGCSGCHLSIADFHESLLDVMELADFEFSPVLMDTKYDEVLVHVMEEFQDLVTYGL